MKAQQIRGLQNHGDFAQASGRREQRSESKNQSISRDQIRTPAPRAFHDQQLVFDGQRFSRDRPNPAGTGKSRENDQQEAITINRVIRSRALCPSDCSQVSTTAGSSVRITNSPHTAGSLVALSLYSVKFAQEPLHVCSMLFFDPQNVSHQLATGDIVVAEPSHDLRIRLDCDTLGH
jgi:hypothetical protein